MKTYAFGDSSSHRKFHLQLRGRPFFTFRLISHPCLEGDEEALVDGLDGREGGGEALVVGAGEAAGEEKLQEAVEEEKEVFVGGARLPARGQKHKTY